MKRLLLICALAISWSSDAAGQRARYMGELSCGAWPKAADYTEVKKAVLLNYVLGYLFGRVPVTGFDIFEYVDTPSVAAWMDNYCQANPLETIIRGAFLLEKELLARRDEQLGSRSN